MTISNGPRVALHNNLSKGCALAAAEHCATDARAWLSIHNHWLINDARAVNYQKPQSTSFPLVTPLSNLYILFSQPVLLVLH